MRIAAKVLNAVETIIIVLIVAAAMLLTVPKALGLYPYVVLSGSMEPTVHVGSMAYINTKDTDVKVRDIIMYQANESTMVIHRINAINDDGTFEMKGDANEDIDFVPVSQEQVRGTYVFSVPGLGYAVTNVKLPHIIIGAIWIIIIHIAAWKLSEFAEEEEDEYEDDDDDDYDYE